MPTVADALAGARFKGAAAAASTDRSVLIAGASGRLGERVLARLLAAPDLRQIFALASNPMPSTEKKLTALQEAEWCFPVDTVIAVISEAQHTSPQTQQHEALPARGRRTEVFSSLPLEDVPMLAQTAKALGVRCFMLMTPVNVFSQPAAVRAQLANVMEAELHQLGFESLMLLRPSDHELRQRTGGIGTRLMRMVSDTAAGLMTGLKHTPLSVEDTARAAVLALRESGDGLTILETEQLHQLLRA